MNLLKELQDIIDRYPKISKQELKDYLENTFSDLYKDDVGVREYDFGKVLYWFSMRNLATLIDDVEPNAQDFDDEAQGIKSLVLSLEDEFIKEKA